MAAVGKAYNDDEKATDQYAMLRRYCAQNSTSPHPALLKVKEETLQTQPKAFMLGADEVLALNTSFIMAMKIIDVGVFTGMSTLAAALASEADAKVIACENNADYAKVATAHWKDAGVDSKVDLRIAPAVETLQALIDKGECGTFDFAFVDADKAGYVTYYELVLKLLRIGGVLILDNTLYEGDVIKDEHYLKSLKDKNALHIKAVNAIIAKDAGRVQATLYNIGDGVTVIVKKK